MSIFLVVLLFVVGVLVVLATIAIGTQVALNRHNRVVSGVRSQTPVSWLASSRREAILHRRLRAAGRRLELLPPTEGLADMVSRLQVELVDLDDHLLTVVRRPTRARRADRKELAQRVTTIEDLVRRLEDRSRDETGSLDELSERLDMLEAADEELRGLEPG